MLVVRVVKLIYSTSVSERDRILSVVLGTLDIAK